MMCGHENGVIRFKSNKQIAQEALEEAQTQALIGNDAEAAWIAANALAIIAGIKKREKVKP